MKKNKVKYIICSAILFKDGKKHVHQPFNIESGFVLCGHRHHNCFMTASILAEDKKFQSYDDVQGFLTNENIFVDRVEAGRIAFEAGQTDELISVLYSEDLY